MVVERLLVGALDVRPADDDVVMVLCGAMMLFVMRGMMGGHRGRSGDRFALNLLKERFARGEITQTEYEERRRLLET